jgi:rod shape-determining protein MreB and related proteins
MTKRDMAIDLGSANTLVYAAGKGIVFDEPTFVAVSRSGQVLAVGHAARELLAKNPADAIPVRPLKRGAVTDFDLTKQMLKKVFRRIGVGRVAKPRVLVCVPSLLTPVERRAVEEAVVAAGAKSASLIDEPLAAAVGAGLPIHEPVGNLVVDVGGGTTEIAVLAMGGTVLGRAIPVGGFDMDGAIQEHVRGRHGVVIGDGGAERLKIELGSAYPAAEARAADVRGRDMGSGMPTTVTVSPDEVREALADVVASLVESTRQVLAEAPPDLAQDVLDTGLFLTGGGAMLRGLTMRLAQECEVPVHLTEQPLATVALGAGHLLDALPDYGPFLAGHRSA